MVTEHPQNNEAKTSFAFDWCKRNFRFNFISNVKSFHFVVFFHVNLLTMLVIEDVLEI